jgi:DNA-binding GntR family transcriptional regulator
MVDIAFDHVRDAILTGALQPGDRVPQDAIAQELNISRMPLREALRRLEAGGFVSIVPHRGATVTPLSREAIEEIYFIRTALEAASAGRAATHMEAARVERLRLILEEAAGALDASDGVALADANRRFHLVGHEASGLPLLSRMIAELSDHSQRYRLLHTQLGARAHVALAEHQQILQAWAARDADAAEEAVRVNLENSERALLDAIQFADDSQPVAPSETVDQGQT